VNSESDPVYALAVQICEHGGNDPVQVAELLRPEIERLTRERDFAQQLWEMWEKSSRAERADLEKAEARNRELEQALTHLKEFIAKRYKGTDSFRMDSVAERLVAEAERVLGAKEE
jgi:hypothetical protein